MDLKSKTKIFYFKIDNPSLTFNEFQMLFSCPPAHLRTGTVVVLELAGLELRRRHFRWFRQFLAPDLVGHDFFFLREILLLGTKHANICVIGSTRQDSSFLVRELEARIQLSHFLELLRRDVGLPSIEAKQIVLSLTFLIRILRTARFGTLSAQVLSVFLILFYLAGFAGDDIFWLARSDPIFV